MAPGSAEIEGLLGRLLAFLQSDRRVRLGIAAVLVAALLAVAGRSIYGLIPRHYTLSITGGDIVTNRHYLARVLQSEAKKQNITLIVRPVDDTTLALKMVSEGKLDLALIPGGLSTVFPNVEHVATVSPEMVHLLVKPGIQGMGTFAATRSTSARKTATRTTSVSPSRSSPGTPRTSTSSRRCTRRSSSSRCRPRRCPTRS